MVASVVGERWVEDNRDKIIAALRKGIERGLLDIADRIAQVAIENADRFTKSGDLQRSIVSVMNQGNSFNVKVTRFDADGNEVEEEGLKVEVPSLDITRTERGFSVEFGCFVPYAAAVEFGTNPHIIVPDPQRTHIAGKPRTNPHLRFGKGGKGDETFTKRVMHPGTSPQPFMRPAIEQVKREAGGLMRRAIATELRRAVGPPEKP